MTKAILLLLVCFQVYALEIPEVRSTESWSEKKQGNAFLQFIWNTGKVSEDIEAQVYLKTLGNELRTHSNNPTKHFDFFMLQDNSINAFAGPYGYIAFYTGTLFSADSEAELAAVLSHEIAHVTQNHLYRFNKKTNKQGLLIATGILAALLTKDAQTSKAITSSTLAGVAQQSINFTREHEWEADRIGLKTLLKSGFDPKAMAHFFTKLKDNKNAQEFLRTHPLSINRISDSMQRVDFTQGDYRDNSFEYESIRARMYYQQYQRLQDATNADLILYMQAYRAFKQQKYAQAKTFIDELLQQNTDNPTYILAGRIYAKIGDLKQAQQYFSKNLRNQVNVYYSAQAYADNQQVEKGAQILRRYLRSNSGDYQSYKLLSWLYARLGKTDRAHIYKAQALVIQGKLQAGIDHYQRAKSITHSQDMLDVIQVKIEQLQNLVDAYKD